MSITHLQRIILGLKVRQFRQELGWSFEDLSRETGISVSYLNEIEKGKKYPKSENREILANALGTTESFLSSPELTRQFAPLGDLLKSNFLSELPLDLFGIEIQKIIEIIARDPDRVNAFISALLEIARVHSLREENFYFSALRAYQELRSNYFEEIEEAVAQFSKANDLPGDGAVRYSVLANLLEKKYGCRIVPDGLALYPDLQEIRCVFNPVKKQLLLNGRLNERQLIFHLAKELGFQVLGLKERPLASSFTRISSFESVLNNYKAAYFAVALLINKETFINDIGAFFALEKWDSQALPGLMEKYQASPEVFFQRFNVIIKHFGLERVFFMRFIHHLGSDKLEVDKELQINRKQQPHAAGLYEHYCRRWISPYLLRQLKNYPAGPDSQHIVLQGIQRPVFLNSGEEYLCIALAKPGYPTAGKNVSVSLGVRLDNHVKSLIRFWNDPQIQQVTVNFTCERCPVTDCMERVSPPVYLQNREKRRKIEEIIAKLSGEITPKR
ncbi:MAG: helix-turn-helix domain-containing protein [Bacteroidota bacterium]